MRILSQKKLFNLDGDYIIPIFVYMISVIEHEGRRVVCSLDVYKHAGYSPINYARWVKNQLHNHAQKDIDYFDITDRNHQETFFPKTWNHRHRALWEKPGIYFLTIDMAISVCFMAKTVKSKKLKAFLQLNK